MYLDAPCVLIEGPPVSSDIPTVRLDMDKLYTISINKVKNDVIDTTVQFRTTVRIIFDEGYEGQNSFSWYIRHGPPEHERALGFFIKPVLTDFVRCGTSKLESTSLDRFSVLWDFGCDQLISLPFQLGLKGYSGSPCRLDITTEALACDLSQSEYLLACCMVTFTSNCDTLDHLWLSKQEIASRSEDQTTTLRTEVRPISWPSRDRSSSVSSRSSSTNSTLRGPAEFDASEQVLDLDGPLIFSQAHQNLQEHETAVSGYVLPPPPISLGSRLPFTCYICEAVVGISNKSQWE